jgi:hypothetical protein
VVISSQNSEQQRPSVLEPAASHGDDLEALADHHLNGRRKSIRGDRDQPGDAIALGLE